MHHKIGVRIVYAMDMCYTVLKLHDNLIHLFHNCNEFTSAWSTFTCSTCAFQLKAHQNSIIYKLISYKTHPISYETVLHRYNNQ